MLKASLRFESANTILYCKHWPEMVKFYRHVLGLPITFKNDWFVEFGLGGHAHISVADEQRASINSAAGAGLTITLKVADADAAYSHLCQRGLEPERVKNHPWGARAFYFFDPEGNRLEIWSDPAAAK